jgi:hypothetical protein
MPTALIVIFLLFFAVLAFGWFYLQRAKARDAATVDSTDAAVATADPAAAAPVAGTYAASTTTDADTGHDHSDHADHDDHAGHDHGDHADHDH